MGIEIEKKFLVNGDTWRVSATGKKYCQGYISRQPSRTVRVRTVGSKGFLTIKGKSIDGSRPEFEYEIPIKDAKQLLAGQCDRPLIEKYRYRIGYKGLVWEVDEFMGSNRGLIIAEVELSSENQAFQSPEWVGREVTGDPKYYNSSLVSHPYCDW